VEKCSKRINKNLKTEHYDLWNSYSTAIRCLQQLIEDETTNYPGAARVAANYFYVGDIITGAEDLPQALKLQHDLMAMPKKGAFHLRKCSSNHPTLLEGIPSEDIKTRLTISFDGDVTKTLGLLWNPTTDKFLASVH
jgi:hypothetical protein